MTQKNMNVGAKDDIDRDGQKYMFRDRGALILSTERFDEPDVLTDDPTPYFRRFEKRRKK